MNKVISIVSIIVASALVLISLPMLFFRIFTPMPEQMKDKTVCFLAPDLTWSSSMSDVTRCFGDPIEKATDYELTGTKTNTYETTYKNQTIQIDATRQMYPHNTNVYEYYFRIECDDKQESTMVFASILNELVEDNSNDEFYNYDEPDESSVMISIDYGATGIYYEIYQTYEFDIVLIAYCQY